MSETEPDYDDPKGLVGKRVTLETKHHGVFPCNDVLAYDGDFITIRFQNTEKLIPREDILSIKICC